MCIHNKTLYYCVPCKGNGICEHKIQRSQCIECGGGSICEHELQRNNCKKCGDVIKITIRNWINSKQKDKKYNRYDEINHIDYEFCKGLIQESGKNCYYCDIELQYIEYNDTLATIQRMDNSIGHIKENCVIACRSCNFNDKNKV